LAPFSPDQARDMLEVVDARSNTGSMVINSQLPLDIWYQNLPDPTVADAILDRIMHNSYRIPLKGESMRKVEASKKLSSARKKKKIASLAYSNRFIPDTWPLVPGIVHFTRFFRRFASGGQLEMECWPVIPELLVGFLWNAWSVKFGINGRFYWNTHL